MNREEYFYNLKFPPTSPFSKFPQFATMPRLDQIPQLPNLQTINQNQNINTTTNDSTTEKLPSPLPSPPIQTPKEANLDITFTDDTQPSNQILQANTHQDRNEIILPQPSPSSFNNSPPISKPSKKIKDNPSSLSSQQKQTKQRKTRKQSSPYQEAANSIQAPNLPPTENRLSLPSFSSISTSPPTITTNPAQSSSNLSTILNPRQSNHSDPLDSTPQTRTTPIHTETTESYPIQPKTTNNLLSSLNMYTSQTPISIIRQHQEQQLGLPYPPSTYKLIPFPSQTLPADPYNTRIGNHQYQQISQPSVHHQQRNIQQPQQQYFTQQPHSQPQLYNTQQQYIQNSRPRSLQYHIQQQQPLQHHHIQQQPQEQQQQNYHIQFYHLQQQQQQPNYHIQPQYYHLQQQQQQQNYLAQHSQRQPHESQHPKPY